MIKPGTTFDNGGFRYEVLQVFQDPGATRAVVRVLSSSPKKPSGKPAPGVAAALLEGALDPLRGARWLGYLEGIEKSADVCATQPDLSGRTLANTLRAEADSLRKTRAT